MITTLTLQQKAREHNWLEFGQLLQTSETIEPEDVYLSIESIYLLLSRLLAREEVPPDEVVLVREILLEIFQRSYLRFRDDPEYLFYVGYFIALCDWCFKQEGLDLSHQMLKRAADAVPTDRLYAWGYAFSTNQSNARQLSMELSLDAELLSKITSKGEAGRFIAKQLENIAEFFET